MKNILLHNATIVNESKTFAGSILLEGEVIKEIFSGSVPADILKSANVFDLSGKYILPGVIDDQVHFREPGLTHKGEIATESKAAIVGGITSYMEMPNTSPQTISMDRIDEKIAIARQNSLANYAFYLGATNDNIDEIVNADPSKICGVKVFMGSSTGNMLVDKEESLRAIFSQVKLPIAVHCEDEATIKANSERYKNKYGEDVPVECHPLIRSDEACYLSSKLAVGLAREYGTRLHILHMSTAKELSLLRNDIPSNEKQITAEVCVHHLWFDDRDYAHKGAFIRWNPAVKTKQDKDALFEALLDDRIDVIATDHAPHTIKEKTGTYFKSASGGPLVQHSLLAMLDFVKQDKISIEKVVAKMCHTPADIFKVKQRGYIRKGYYADFAVVDLNNSTTVKKDNILYKCKWSPFEDVTFAAKVYQTWVNGNLVFSNGFINDTYTGKQLEFER